MTRRAGRVPRPCSRKSCRWSPRPSAASAPIQKTGRPGRGLVRAGGHRDRRSLAFVVWAFCGPAPSLAFALVTAVVGADHRVSLRARARHADVDHGRRSGAARKRACSSRTRRRSSGSRRSTPSSWTRPAPSPRASRSWSRSLPAAGSDEADAPHWPHRSNSRASIRWPHAIVQGAESARLSLAAGRRISRRLTGKGVVGKVAGRRVAIGNAGADGGTRVAGEARMAERCRPLPRRRCDRHVRRRSTGRSAGLVAVADPIKPTTREALIECCAPKGSTVDHAHRRQSAHGAKPSRASSGIDEVQAGVLSAGQDAAIVRASSAQVASSRWPATASMTRRRWPRPTSASRWARARTSRWRAPA